MEERDQKGRFAKGNKVGKGRPKKKAEDKYLRWMQRRVKKEAWDHIVDVAIARAESGDNQARQWLSDYLMGKPAQQVQVEGDVGFSFPEFVEVRIRRSEDQPPPGPE